MSTSLETTAPSTPEAGTIDQVNEMRSGGQKVCEGNTRGAFLTSRANTLFLLGMTVANVKDQLKEENKASCQPPLEDAAIERTVESTFEVIRRAGLPGGNGFRYFVRPDGIYKAEGKKDSAHLSKLTNFTVTSIRQIIADNGVEKQHTFEIKARLGKRENTIEISAEEFSKMLWPMSALGPDATVAPHKEKEAKFAIQITAKRKPDQFIHTHTGWKVIDGKPYYLHAGGAIGATGTRRDIRATLPTNLRRFSLPDPPKGEQAKSAVRASLRMLDVAKATVSFPIYAAVVRAALPNAALTVYTSGSTGLFKTATNLLAQQHYGAEFDEESILHWDSTSNFLKEALFIAKDAVLIVDDFVPTGGSHEINRAHSAADSVLRGVGNRAGRGRLGRDGRAQEPHPPRALVLSTGEDRPRGHSLAARIVHVVVAEGSVDKQELSRCQADAKSGLYAQAMAGYIQFLASRYDNLSVEVKNRTAELRNLLAAPGRHPKSAENFASLAVGFEYYLSFAVNVGAISEEQAEEYWNRFWRIISKLADDQDQLQHNQDVVRDALRRLKEAQAAEKIFLEEIDPDPGEAVIPPKGAIQIGYFDTDVNGKPTEWYLFPDATIAALQQHYNAQGLTFPLSQETFMERMAQRGYSRVEEGRFKCKKRVNGKQDRFICIPIDTFARIEAEMEGEGRGAAANVPIPRWERKM